MDYLDPTIKEIDRKLDILRDNTDRDVIGQITQLAEVNGVDSEFVKDFMEYLVQKKPAYILTILYTYDSILNYAGYTYWRESESISLDFSIVGKIVITAYQRMSSSLHEKIAKLLFIWNKNHIFEDVTITPILDHLGIRPLFDRFRDKELALPKIVHYRQFSNPTLISKFNVEVDKLETPDLPTLQLCKGIANENNNNALDFVNYFVEKASCISKKRRYPFLCLIDIILKDCGDSFKHFFENKIVKIMTNIYKDGDPEKKIVKVIGVWKDRNTFDSEIIENIESALVSLSDRQSNRQQIPIQIPRQQQQQQQQQQQRQIRDGMNYPNNNYISNYQQHLPLQPIKREYVNEGYIKLKSIDEISSELIDKFDTSIYFESNYLDPPTCQYGINDVLKLLKEGFENEDSNIYYSKVKKPQFKLSNQDKITKNKDLINLLYQNKQCDLCGLRYPIELLEEHKGDHATKNSIYVQGTKYRNIFLTVDEFEINEIKEDTVLIGLVNNQQDEIEEDENNENDNTEDGIVKESEVEIENPICEYCKGEFQREWNEKVEEMVFMNMWISFNDGEQQFYHRECYDIVHPKIVETKEEDDNDDEDHPHIIPPPPPPPSAAASSSSYLYEMAVKRESSSNKEDEGFGLFKKIKTE